MFSHSLKNRKRYRESSSLLVGTRINNKIHLLHRIAYNCSLPYGLEILGMENYQIKETGLFLTSKSGRLEWSFNSKKIAIHFKAVRSLSDIGLITVKFVLGKESQEIPLQVKNLKIHEGIATVRVKSEKEAVIFAFCRPDELVSVPLAWLSTVTPSPSYTRLPDIPYPFPLSADIKDLFILPKFLNPQEWNEDIRVNPQLGFANPDRPVVEMYGNLKLFHYNCDSTKDAGWGCAYRVCQMILSWILLQGIRQIQIPSILEMQEILVQMKDKPDNWIGSSKWIGSFEVALILEHLCGISCEIISVQPFQTMTDFIPTFQEYFEEVGSPIFVGGDSYAYLLVGVGNQHWMVIDPHWKGENPVDAVRLMNLQQIFNKGTFYNFLLPRLL